MTKRVLILCTGNSCRSQMAEGLINHYLADQWQAVSAGTEPSGAVHPLAIAVMAELDIDISAGRSKHVDLFRAADLDTVITVCADAEQTCPTWIGAGKAVHIGFDDPARAVGAEEAKMAVFRRVRDEIRRDILGYLRQL